MALQRSDFSCFQGLGNVASAQTVGSSQCKQSPMFPLEGTIPTHEALGVL